MKKLAYFLTASLLAFSLSSFANVRVAESIIERFATATRSGDLLVNLGVATRGQSLTAVQKVERLNSFLNSGSQSSQAMAQRLRIFETALSRTGNVNMAFNEAFVINGSLVSSQLLTTIAANSAATATSTIDEVLNTIETSQQRGSSNACNQSITTMMDPSRVSRFTTALRTLELKADRPVLSGVSCAVENAEMANAVADIVIKADQEIVQNGSLSLDQAVQAAYASHMNVSAEIAAANLSKLETSCNIRF